MSLKRALSPELRSSEPQRGDAPVDIFRSAPIDDRSSTFIALFSPNLKPKDLQARPEIASASHKILGWRRESNQQSINKTTRYVTGADEDGERFSGKHVIKALETAQVTGAVVVARWYGGINLGPVRFAHIENSAVEAIRLYSDHQAETLNKKRRLAQEDANRDLLSKTLVERDDSIRVLRALAQEKELMLKQISTNADSDNDPQLQAETPPANTPSKVAPNYTAMPLSSLKRLEKARDATLGFLLKRIDEAEAKLGRQANADSSDKPP